MVRLYGNLLALLVTPTALAARVEVEQTLDVDGADSGPWTLAHPRNARWPAGLSANYTEIRRLACGMHGCAYLAAEKASGKEVVVKLSDENAVEEECGEMRYLRYQACKTGEEILRLHETYIPNCNDFGRLRGHRRYMVLPMAGAKQISKFQRNNTLSVELQMTYFAQLVAGVYGLHASGYRHLDLNGGNMIVDDKRLAVIDFGLVQKTDCEGRCRRGMSRDANGVYRWAAVLANCPQAARFKKAWWVRANIRAQRTAQKKAVSCLKKRWNPDAAFISALEKVFEANLQESGEQHLDELYGTSFVQKNLPKETNRFFTPGTEGCASWDDKRLLEEISKNGALEVK